MVLLFVHWKKNLKMNYRSLIIILFLLCSCTGNIQFKNPSIKEKKTKFINSGFTLVYNDNLFLNKIVNKKMNERDLIIFQKNWKPEIIFVAKKNNNAEVNEMIKTQKLKEIKYVWILNMWILTPSLVWHFYIIQCLFQVLSQWFSWRKQPILIHVTNQLF